MGSAVWGVGWGGCGGGELAISPLVRKTKLDLSDPAVYKGNKLASWSPPSLPRTLWRKHRDGMWERRDHKRGPARICPMPIKHTSLLPSQRPGRVVIPTSPDILLRGEA